MKRVIFILGVIVGLLLITFVLQNRFLLGVPFVEKGKTTWTDADRLLGKRYEQVYMDTAGPGGVTGRVYFAHFASYIICEYQLELSGRDENYLKYRVDSITWGKAMCWDRIGVLKELDRLARQH